MSHRLARWVVRRTAPLVQRVARAYGLRVDQHCVALGQHPLVIADPPERARGNIPRSVMFNTRSGAIYVGANTTFGEEVMLLTGKHLDIAQAEARGVPQHHVPESGRDIVVGSGCYIGARAIVIGPVRIGDFAVIGAGAVVTHDVPPRTMVVGVPARVIRSLDAEPSRRPRGQA